jgi:hypothetical protein
LKRGDFWSGFYFGRFSARLVPGFFYGFRVVSFIALGEFLIHVNKFRVYKNSYLRSSLKTQQTCGGNSQLSLYLFARWPHFVNTVTLKYCSVHFVLAGVTKYKNSGRNMQLLDTIGKEKSWELGVYFGVTKYLYLMQSVV